METLREQKVESRRTVSESRGEWHGRIAVLNIGKLKVVFRYLAVHVGRLGTRETRAFAAWCTWIDSEGSFCHFQARFKSQAACEFDF